LDARRLQDKSLLAGENFLRYARPPKRLAVISSLQQRISVQSLSSILPII